MTEILRSKGGIFELSSPGFVTVDHRVWGRQVLFVRRDETVLGSDIKRGV